MSKKSQYIPGLGHVVDTEDESLFDTKLSEEEQCEMILYAHNLIAEHAKKHNTRYTFEYKNKDRKDDDIKEKHLKVSAGSNYRNVIIGINDVLSSHLLVFHRYDRKMIERDIVTCFKKLELVEPKGVLDKILSRDATCALRFSNWGELRKYVDIFTNTVNTYFSEVDIVNYCFILDTKYSPIPDEHTNNDTIFVELNLLCELPNITIRVGLDETEDSKLKYILKPLKHREDIKQDILEHLKHFYSIKQKETKMENKGTTTSLTKAEQLMAEEQNKLEPEYVAVPVNTGSINALITSGITEFYLPQEDVNKVVNVIEERTQLNITIDKDDPRPENTVEQTLDAYRQANSVRTTPANQYVPNVDTAGYHQSKLDQHQAALTAQAIDGGWYPNPSRHLSGYSAPNFGKYSVSSHHPQPLPGSGYTYQQHLNSVGSDHYLPLPGSIEHRINHLMNELQQLQHEVLMRAVDKGGISYKPYQPKVESGLDIATRKAHESLINSTRQLMAVNKQKAIDATTIDEYSVYMSISKRYEEALNALLAEQKG